MAEKWEPTISLYARPSMLKPMLESMCLAQTHAKSAVQRDIFQMLINQIDCYRPLGPDGKHGNRHTVRCGCEDK